MSEILKRQRTLLSLTLREVAAKSGVSSSHLGRIERGQRFPSARILLKIAAPLGFNVEELFVLAGYLNNRPTNHSKRHMNYRQDGRLDSSVAMMLSQEPVEVQRTVLAVLSIIKYLARKSGVNSSMAKIPGRSMSKEECAPI